MNGTRSIPQRRVEPEEHRDDHRHAAEDAGPRRDPERLGRDQLLGVDGRREDRVVGALELVLDERPEHRRERAREEHRRRHDPRADEVDVVVAADAADERAEAEAEREQVDGRLDRRRERRRAPVRGEVDDLAHEHARDRGPLEPADRRTARAAVPSLDLLAREEDEDVLEVRRPALALGHVAVAALDRRARRRSSRCAASRSPRPWASASASASFAGEPYTSTRLAPRVLVHELGRAARRRPRSRGT